MAVTTLLAAAIFDENENTKTDGIKKDYWLSQKDMIKWCHWKRIYCDEKEEYLLKVFREHWQGWKQGNGKQRRALWSRFYLREDKCSVLLSKRVEPRKKYAFVPYICVREGSFFIWKNTIKEENSIWKILYRICYMAGNKSPCKEIESEGTFSSWGVYCVTLQWGGFYCISQWMDISEGTGLPCGKFRLDRLWGEEYQYCAEYNF